jgi:F-type H+-transporting ATPase subunit delta
LANLETIARPYAKAAFSQAREDDCLAQWSAGLQSLALIAADPKMVMLYGNPKLTDVMLSDLIGEVLSEVAGDVVSSLGDKLKNFLMLLIEEKRMPALEEINVLFHQLMADYNRVVEAHVISAFALSKAQQKGFYGFLEKRLDSKVSIDFQEDRSLIGGALVRSGNWVLDGTIRGKLTRLDEVLTS